MDLDRESAAEKNMPRYDLTKEQACHLAEQLLIDNVDRLQGGHRYVAVEISGKQNYANIGRYIERTVFEASFGNDANEMAEEYGPYEDASTFFVSIDTETREPTGVLRVIQDSENGLKSWDDAGEHFGLDAQRAAQNIIFQDRSKIWDVGTIAVLPEYRKNSGPVSILLERAMYVAARDRNIQTLISIIDDAPLIKMRSKWRGVGIPFKDLPGTKPQAYLGSEKSHAVYGHVPDFYEKMSRHRESLRGRLIAKYALGDALDRLVEGTADDAILLLEDYKN